MVSVNAALRTVLENARSFGSEKVALKTVLGRILAEDVGTDRDIPPYNRATMDGVAIRFEDVAVGTREFQIISVQAAGDVPVASLKQGGCVQIMTGAAVPHGADTVIPSEEILVRHRTASLLNAEVVKGQFIHSKGSDKNAGDIVISAGRMMSPAAVAIAASVGQKRLLVSRLPRVVVITTGNELIGIDQKPAAYQIRRSNNYAIGAILSQYGAVADMIHMPDDAALMKRELKRCLKDYDAIIVSGGVSKGKFDHIPGVLKDLSVKELFHGVKQKPGKPFWFGVQAGGPVVFALPGNPVSTFLCSHKYILPWLRACLDMPEPLPLYAELTNDIGSPRLLHYFLQTKLRVNSHGKLLATPIDNTGSGDFVSLLEADGFLELPPGQTNHNAGKTCKILATQPIL